MLGIGIDTGGTCTDAVLYDFDRKKVLSSGKTLTTKENLETGIARALDMLPKELVSQAEMMVLSTTLATNACLENRGARAKLLLIGFDEDLLQHLQGTYAAYGLTDRSRLVFLDARVEGLYSNPYDPDWDRLRKDAKTLFGDCDSVGIVQKHPRANGGRFELTARDILLEELDVPVTISCDISNETDILRTCAGTMLNARLVPLVSDFMKAVHHVMEKRGLDIPISIVRSDGTVMPEQTAYRFPVETILSGPAASAAGAACLAGSERGIVVDMGGTTTDIAIIQDGIPLQAKEGIRIGPWKTMVRGIRVETIALGGDTAVRFAEHALVLDTVRVIPLSVLASRYDHVLPYLERLAEDSRAASCPMYEFFLLQKDISDKSGYSDYERKLCEELREKPLSIQELASRMGRYPRLLATEYLEEEGAVMRSGLTPTDMMILKGDYTLYGAGAARAAVRYLAAQTGLDAAEVPDAVYDLVCRRMYHCLGRVILQQEYPAMRSQFTAEYLKPLLDCFYEQAEAVRRQRAKVDGAGAGEVQTAGKNGAGTDEERTAEMTGAQVCGEENPETHSARLSLASGLPLIGAGAPVHVFLPRVADLLRTQAIIPVHAGVANALGAAAGQRAAQCELKVESVYRGASFMGYAFSDRGKRWFFTDLEEALKKAREILESSIREKARLHGMKEDAEISVEEEEFRLDHRPDGLLFEVRLTARARSRSVSVQSRLSPAGGDQRDA